MMVESLFAELRFNRLHANPLKTKILKTDDHYSNAPAFIDIDGDLVDVLHSNASHKYLRRMKKRQRQSPGRTQRSGP